MINSRAHQFGINSGFVWKSCLETLSLLFFIDLKRKKKKRKKKEKEEEGRTRKLLKNDVTDMM